MIESVANIADLPRATAERAVNVVFDDIAKALRQGDKVNISAFGTFALSTRKERTGRNPKTGETITIAASKAVKFKAGKALKDSVN